MCCFNSKKVLGFIATALALTALSGVVTVATAATVLRFGHGKTPGELGFVLFQKLAENVDKRTHGEVKIQVFPGEQLGKENDMIQQVKSGALDISESAMSGLSILVPALEIASGPFLWKDWAQAEKVIRGPAFQPLFDELRDKHNIEMLTKIWYWGWRNLTTGTRPVNKPEDMAGMKIRVPESAVWVEMIRAMGAAPTPIPFGEVYTALQMKLVDGQENPIPTIYTRKYYEVQPYLAMTRHMLQNNTLIINKRSLAKLSPEMQKILIEEAEKLSEENAKGQQELEASMLEEIRKTGKTTITDPDRAAFAAKMSPVYKNMESRWGAENLQRIRAAIESAK
jgi:tripartite ATP-independent transporter DctP family solute receptor